jgi:transcriptional regulator with XRE-family HTH domain
VVADRAKVQALRRSLGAQLAMYRTGAGVIQPHLGQRIGKSRSMISRIEHGTRTMPEALWTIADEVCAAQGALIAQYHRLAEAEQDYRAQCRAQRAQVQQRQAQAQVEALQASPPGGGGGLEVWMEMMGVDGALVGELRRVVRKLVQAVGRRKAIRLLGSLLAVIGSSGLDGDDYTRLTDALEAPHRVDIHVVNNLAIMLAQCKRLEDKLGPCEVLDTVIAQHELVHHLLEGGCPERLRKPLSLVDSNMASAIGGYLIDMSHPQEALRYFTHARRAGHTAGNPACAAYAAANTGFAAFLRADTPTALDTTAAARSLAARTNDPRLKALAEQMAAAAHALDGQYQPCMAACDRAQELLTSANGSAPESLAYWLTKGTLDSQRSIFLCHLDKPTQAVEAALTARAAKHSSLRPVGATHLEIRLAHALVLSKDITQAAHILGDAATQAHLFPRLTTELHTARALMQPWQHTKAVKELDTQLETCRLLPTHHTPNTTPGAGASIQQA